MSTAGLEQAAQEGEFEMREETQLGQTVYRQSLT
jgi:hypothetical protein